MSSIQKLADATVREFLKSSYRKFGGRPLRAKDFMDDGTIIALEIRIDPEKGQAVFDWTGSGPQSHSNFNTPFSLSLAAIIYCLRCMIQCKVIFSWGYINLCILISYLHNFSGYSFAIKSRSFGPNTSYCSERMLSESYRRGWYVMMPIFLHHIMILMNFSFTAVN